MDLAQYDSEETSDLKLRIQGAGYGQIVYRAYEDTYERLAKTIGISVLSPFTSAVSLICIKSGKTNCVLFCQSAINLGFDPLTHDAFIQWQTKIIEITTEFPFLLRILLENMVQTTKLLNLNDWLAWLSTGLRYGSNNTEKLISYFSLASNESLGFLYQLTGTITFGFIKERLQLELQALFALSPDLRINISDKRGSELQRSSLSGPVFFLPNVFSGDRHRATQTYQAAAFHLAAHRVYGGPPFEVGQLKPMQIAITSLIEDARVEMLAAKELPGLLRLWKSFHDISPEGVNTAPRMFARLSRALIDRDYYPTDAWVLKGKKMFFAAQENWYDPRISRVIGNLLGNDLGQLRVQFNAKDYIVEPKYRDDNNGLWAFQDDTIQQPQSHELEVDSVDYRKLSQNEDLNPQAQNATKQPEYENIGKAKPAELLEQDGQILKKFPEYDYDHKKLRPNWVTVKEYKIPLGSASYWDQLEKEYAQIIKRSEKLFRSLVLGDTYRLKRQKEGEKLDLDSAISAAISLRTAVWPEQNVYEGKSKPQRSMATYLLLDTSESTRDQVYGVRKSIIELERDAAAILAKAIAPLGEPLAITGFCSDGKDDVRVQPIKRFEDDLNVITAMNLSGLTPGYSTRMGAALRYSGESLNKIQTRRKLIMLITDGQPSDIDISDLEYLISDTKHAVSELKNMGIDVFCVALGENSNARTQEIFGKSRCLVINNLKSLPEKLAPIYFKLTS